MARGYGQVSAVMVLGTLYLQFRRAGWSKSTLGLALLLLSLALVNVDWISISFRSDIRLRVNGNAFYTMWSVGTLLLWQVIAALKSLKTQKTRSIRVA